MSQSTFETEIVFAFFSHIFNEIYYEKGLLAVRPREVFLEAYFVPR